MSGAKLNGSGRASKATLEGIRLGLARAGCEFEVTNNGADGTVLTTACVPCELAGQASEMTITVTANHYEYACPAGHDDAAFVAAIAPRLNGDAQLRPAKAYPVTYDLSGKTPKLLLPDTPSDTEDTAALCAWLTSVLRLDPCHPVNRAMRYGRRGQDAHIVIERAGLEPGAFLRFEPAAIISSARRFRPALEWQLGKSDERPYGFKDDHCAQIADVVRLLAAVERALDDHDETAAIIGALTFKGKVMEGHTTYGTGGQRYEAAQALQRTSPLDGPRYLIDATSGELVVRTGDLQVAAREHTGSSLAHGWLDARLGELGWHRVTLQGWALPGREGRRGPHLRCDVYRGHLPTDAADDAVNTGEHADIAGEDE
jgi:hypothetical protein